MQSQIFALLPRALGAAPCRLIFKERFEKLSHIIAVICTAKLTDGVHRKNGVTDVNGHNAVFCGDHRADGAAASAVAAVIAHPALRAL